MEVKLRWMLRSQQVHEVVNNEGVIQANQYHAQDGVIHLTAQGGDVRQAGLMQAQGRYQSRELKNSVSRSRWYR